MWIIFLTAVKITVGLSVKQNIKYTNRHFTAGGDFFVIQEIAISCIIKTLREDATRAETKMHLQRYDRRAVCLGVD